MNREFIDSPHLRRVPGDYAARLWHHFGERIVSTWLQEFGYPGNDGFLSAVRERPERIVRELDIHAKRLAERAQMRAGPIQGRATVIR